MNQNVHLHSGGWVTFTMPRFPFGLMVAVGRSIFAPRSLGE